MSARRYAYCAWAAAVVVCSCVCSAAARELLDVRLPTQAPPAPAAPQPHPARRRHRRGYCERADPAWRAYLAPAVFEGRVRSVGGEGEEASATFEVRRVMKRSGGWPRRAATLRVKLAPPPRAPDCTGRLEVPLRNGRNYIVFAERRGHGFHALGPPLKRTRKLVKRVRAVFAPDYPRGARVRSMESVRAAPDQTVRLECHATARPPPRISWYRDGAPLRQLYLRRVRVLNFRRRSVLVIRHARREDSARYECRAQGAVGPAASQAANVTVVSAVAPNTNWGWGTQCPMPDPSSYCLNGGTCVFFETVGEPACHCPEGFNGQRCENKDVSSNRNSMYPYHSFTCKLGLSTSYYC